MACRSEASERRARTFDLDGLIRPNIRNLSPYVCARHKYDTGLLLDANENSYGASISSDQNYPLHRYPSPLHNQIKSSFLRFRKVASVLGPSNVFMGVGSDEVIDLLMRVTCTPGKDSICITPPTYGMYKVAAAVNDVGVETVTLRKDFQLNVPDVLEKLEHCAHIKLLFLCSPGNPTGVQLLRSDIQHILESPVYRGLVVVDEAYVDFAGYSCVDMVKEYPNLVVMQTVSKAFGLAAIRLGFGFADERLISYMNNTKAPYNISALTAAHALRALESASIALMQQNVQSLIRNRGVLASRLRAFPQVLHIHHSDANYLLVQFGRHPGTPDSDYARSIQTLMAEREGVVVRYRGNEPLCEGCLRMTVGTEDENATLIERLARVLEEV